MDRILAIVNPVSGRGTGRTFWATARERLKRAGLDVAEAITDGPEETRLVARRAASEGFQTVLYVGGDGTGSEVANGLMAVPADLRPRLAALPLGTGSDFTRSLGMRPGIDAAIARLLASRERVIDVAHSSYLDPNGEPQERFFINVGDAGLGGVVVERVARAPKALGGFVAFLWSIVSGFWTFDAPEMHLSVDGVVRHQGRAAIVVAANGRYFASGLRVAPNAQPDDGLLDVIVVGDVTKADLLLNLVRLYRGTYLSHPKVRSYRGREIVVEASRPVLLDLDGECPGTTPLHVRVDTRALRVIS